MESIAALQPPQLGVSQQCFQRLFARSWFKRVWVLQEIALANIALVICGSNCVPWGYFPEWCARNRKFMFDHGISNLPTMTRYGLMPDNSSLLQQLHDTRDSESAKPHDEVYGVLGLLSSEERSGVPVDYSQSTSSLFTRAARAIISRELSMDAIMR